jgi:hypothetical protein
MENQKLKDAIAGIWHNPASKNIYCFYPPKIHEEYGEMSLLQFKARMPIIFRYKLIQKENLTYLDLDGRHHQIMIVNKSDTTVSLVSSPEETIILSKGFPEINKDIAGIKTLA